ncbi:MAG TPA: penicillin-binding protein [Candidatus Eisenbacteria bacterium]
MAAAGLFVLLVALWLRVAWLQLVMHAAYEERAERNQEQRVLIRPARGELVDRHGRPLARDLPTYSISAAPREMKDARAVARAMARILGMDARRLERDFDARPRFLWVARRVAPDAGQRISDQNWRGVYVSIETQREYTLGPAAQEIVGRTDLDNSGVEGLELAFDDALRGRPGWATLIRDGRGDSHALPRGMRRAAENGSQVVLTLDSELQSILETHLARAVDTLRAVRGFGLFLDPRTGEVLAAVDVPHLPPGRCRNWTFTDQYEPGSTFKAVAAGAALEEHLATPDQYFDAGNGVCDMGGGAIFHDTHKRPGFTFRDAVRFSSNIVMGKIGLLVGPERLYRYATSLGFGSVTGVGFPGEAGGKLRRPEDWSGRSCPTIAIGHEVCVTPLQLALAYGAVANGGVLMEPMLAREVRDADGSLVRRFTPMASHRVFSEATTRTLREMLTAVVDSGTARPARIPGFPIAGKTGTAQKYDAATGTYGRGLYLSSFVGMAPADHPTIVGVIVIDEPHSKHYYGGEIAAPVFREVILDLRRLPAGPFDWTPEQIAMRPPAPAPVVVPDLRLLPPRTAEQRLLGYGLRAHFEGAGARALAQSPAAGEAAERGAQVTVWLSAPDDSAARRLPDLVGLPAREALRRLSLLQVPARIEGMGRVVHQDPAPGTALPLRAACRLWCGAGSAGLTAVMPGATGAFAVASLAAGPPAPSGRRKPDRNAEP